MSIVIDIINNFMASSPNMRSCFHCYRENQIFCLHLYLQNFHFRDRDRKSLQWCLWNSCHYPATLSFHFAYIPPLLVFFTLVALFILRCRHHNIRVLLNLIVKILADDASKHLIFVKFLRWFILFELSHLSFHFQHFLLYVIAFFLLFVYFLLATEAGGISTSARVAATSARAVAAAKTTLSAAIWAAIGKSSWPITTTWSGATTALLRLFRFSRVHYLKDHFWVFFWPIF